MKLKITTLVIVEEDQVLDIFHSLKDNQEDAEHEIIDMVEEEYGDEDENIHFKSIQDIEDCFEIVHIETQKLTSIKFKTVILYTWLSLTHRDKIYHQIPNPTNKQKYIYLILQIILLILLETLILRIPTY